MTKKTADSLLLKKWLTMGFALRDKRLNRVSVAVLWSIMERFNQSKGYSWPGYTRLSNDTGFSRRHVARTISLLEKAGYITTIEKGHPGRSNRYQIHWKSSASEVTSDGQVISDFRNTKLVTDKSSSSDNQDNTQVSQMSPEPSYKPGYHSSDNNRVNITDSIPTETGKVTPNGGAAPNGAPPGVSFSQKNAVDKCISEFKKSYPKLITNTKLLTELITNEIVSKGLHIASKIAIGISDYGRYIYWSKEKAKRENRVYEDRFIISPINFIKDERYREQWFSIGERVKDEIKALEKIKVERAENKALRKKQRTRVSNGDNDSNNRKHKIVRSYI